MRTSSFPLLLLLLMMMMQCTQVGRQLLLLLQLQLQLLGRQLVQIEIGRQAAAAAGKVTREMKRLLQSVRVA